MYLAVTQGYWGRGATIDEAIKKMRQSGARGRNIPIIIYESTDPTVELDRYGMILTDADKTTVEIERRNFKVVKTRVA
jgi:hypothetical protein